MGNDVSSFLGSGEGFLSGNGIELGNLFSEFREINGVVSSDGVGSVGSLLVRDGPFGGGDNSVLPWSLSGEGGVQESAESSGKGILGGDISDHHFV